MATLGFKQSRTDTSRMRLLVLLSFAELLVMSLWFTGTAVLPQITSLWHSDLALGSWLTIAVQVGFALGAVVFALFNIPDVFSPVAVMVVSAVVAAAANAGFALVARDPLAAILLRGVTGFFLAGVYPVGMKIMAGWFQRGRGLALGIMIAALTVGSAVPHGVNSVGGVPWPAVVLLGSVQAVAGALIVAVAVRQGPYAMPQSRLRLSQALEIVRNRRVRLANLGYLGHMWELYSMWGWIAVVFASANRWSKPQYEGAAALTIAIGAVGCIWAGLASDRFQDEADHARVGQRARVTIVAMAISAACCLMSAVVYRQPALLLAVALIWGIVVIADSAQFSTIISEVSDKSYVGTALTIQTALGFLLTAFSIRCIAALAAHLGWQRTLPWMAIGPVLGIWAMRGLLASRQPATPG